MREIKFRGYSNIQMLGSQWIYGNLYINYDDKLAYIDDQPVYFDSVGQYTDLKDKHGKAIYKTDIIEFNDFWDEISGGHKEGNIRRGIVGYLGSGFRVTCHEEYEEDLFLLKINDGELKVVGNIYENPELLEDDCND